MRSSAEVVEVKRIRDHVVGFEPPDLCVVRFGETVTGEDVRAIYEVELRLAEEHGEIYLMGDLAGVRTMTAEARKWWAEVETPPQILGIANFAPGFHLSVLAKLVMTLRRLSGHKSDEHVYGAIDEADARAWIAKRRLERARKGG
jgi:hypothetical protein